MDLTDLILNVLRRQGPSGRRPAMRALMADARLAGDVERVIDEFYAALDVDVELDSRTLRLAFREACGALRIEAADHELLEHGMKATGIFGEELARTESDVEDDPITGFGWAPGGIFDLRGGRPAAVAKASDIAQLLEVHRELLRVHAELLARLGPRPEAPPEHK
jgi:hypothetical protein